jgi:hypothetical protein
MSRGWPGDWSYLCRMHTPDILLRMGTSHSNQGVGNRQLQKPVLSVMPSSSAEVRWMQ